MTGIREHIAVTADSTKLFSEFLLSLYPFPSRSEHHFGSRVLAREDVLHHEEKTTTPAEFREFQRHRLPTLLANSWAPRSGTLEFELNIPKIEYWTEDGRATLRWTPDGLVGMPEVPLLYAAFAQLREKEYVRSYEHLRRTVD